MSNKNSWNAFTVIVWCLFWPLSQLFGTPAEADYQIKWGIALKLFGIAIVTCLVALLVYS